MPIFSILPAKPSMELKVSGQLLSKDSARHLQHFSVHLLGFLPFAFLVEDNRQAKFGFNRNEAHHVLKPFAQLPMDVGKCENLYKNSNSLALGRTSVNVCL